LIKAAVDNFELAQKYKEYTKIRDYLSGKTPSLDTSSPSKPIPRKRKAETVEPPTPSKRHLVDQTPSKTKSHPSIVDPYDSPSVIRTLFTPSKSIGPTPQKDGQVLGLFDLLQEEAQNSPLKSAARRGSGQNGMNATPSKSRHFAEPASTTKHSRTPASSGKQFMLANFVTPSKRKQPNENGAKTPQSVSKLHFATPSFLRRDSQRIHMPAVDEDEEGLPVSPQMVRMPKKPLVRGLSSMLAGLRKMEEDAADEDLEALREMESEATGASKPRPLLEPAVLAEDSQVRLPLGGFDAEDKYDTEPEDNDLGIGPDGQPLKVYKKRGQKRTTRRVIIRPNAAKPTSQSEPHEQDSSGDEYDPPSLEQPESGAQDSQTGFTDVRNFDSDSASEYTASDGGTRYKRPNQKKKDGKVRTAVRKVGALAHTNFKRLKLRNSGAKGGPSHNSRFRRKK
jgi:DNA replication regulator SLD2